MAIKLYRRHLRDCRDGRTRYDTTWLKCGCPIWVRGTLGGQKVNESLKTSNMTNATQQRAKAELRGTWEETVVVGPDGAPPKGITVEDACQLFNDDVKLGRRLSHTSVKKYTLLLSRLCYYAKLRGIHQFSDFTTNDISLFRQTWKMGALTAMKQLELLKSFFQFATDRGWIARNVARPVKAPSPKPTQAQPFTKDEMNRLYDACERLDIQNGYGAGNHQGITNEELLTFVLVLRWTGLRIGDVGLLTTDRVHDGKVLLYTQKTGQHVYAPLPPAVAQRLANTRLRHGKYFFVPGRSFDLDGIAGVWRLKITRAAKLAGIEGGNPHRLRHTFAVDLLEKGTHIESVAMLLGHQSIKTTQQHYSAWTQGRQAQLEAEVAKTWGDAILNRIANVIPFGRKKKA